MLINTKNQRKTISITKKEKEKDQKERPKKIQNERKKKMTDPVSLKKLFYYSFLFLIPIGAYALMIYFASKRLRQVPKGNKEVEVPQAIKEPRK